MIYLIEMFSINAGSSIALYVVKWKEGNGCGGGGWVCSKSKFHAGDWRHIPAQTSNEEAFNKLILIIT